MIPHNPSGVCIFTLFTTALESCKNRKLEFEGTSLMDEETEAEANLVAPQLELDRLFSTLLFTEYFQ